MDPKKCIKCHRINTPLVSIKVLRYDEKMSNVKKGRVRTEIKLVLEHT